MAAWVILPPEWRTEARALIALALPLILGNLAQGVIWATDLIYLGRLGPDALAAASLGINLYVPFIVMGQGLLSALSPLIARERGRMAHSVRDVRRTVRQGLWIAVALVIPCWIVLWQCAPILRAIGEDPGLANDAGIFVRILMWSLLPYFLHLALRNYIAALERALWVTIILFATMIINAVGGWVLIFGHLGAPMLGLRGAAFASATSNLFLCVGLATVVMWGKDFRRYRIFGRFWRADWPRFVAILRLGVPIAAMIVLEVGVFNLAVIFMGLIGRTSLAAHAIAIQLAASTFMVPLGIAQAATVRVGFGYGAGDHGLIARAGWLAILIGVGFMALMALMLTVIPRPLIGIFLDLRNPANAEVIRVALGFLSIAALFQVFDGVQTIGANVLRGLQDTRWPLIYALFGYWVVGLGVGLLLAFPFGLKGLGIWMGLASGLATVAVLVSIRWLRREKLGLLPTHATDLLDLEIIGDRRTRM